MTASPGWVHVARYGAHDLAGVLRGYRLTFRAMAHDSDVTSAIAAAFTDSSLESIVGHEPSIVTSTLPYLSGELPIPFPPGDVTLEMPVDAAAAVGEPRLMELARAGYGLAAIVSNPLSAAIQPPCVSTVVADARDEELAAIARQARSDGRRCVAVSITDAPALDRARAAACDLLVGPAVSMPEVVRARALPSSRLAAMRLIGLVGDPDVDVSAVEDLVKTDASLSYRVLRVANSAASGASRSTSSLRDAIVRIGLRQLRSWLLLMLVSDVADAPEDQLVAAVTRARACELLAGGSGVDPGEAFVVGLLASVSPLLGRDPGSLAVELGLQPDLVTALRADTGDLAVLLHAVERYEAGDLASAHRPAPAGSVTSLTGDDVASAWLTAMAWSLQAVRAAGRPVAA